jgi:hypothetical protein
VLIAEFGSKHNGVQDFFSDKDMLIVGQNWLEISEQTKIYEAYGYSVSAFTDQKANFLSSQGSLFFKHIIDESRVLYDDPSTRQNIKEKWAPRINYNSEIESNIDLLELLKYRPNTMHMLNFINDLIIVSIRNILIRKIAEYGKYVFGWDQIFSISLKLSFLKEQDIKILKSSKKIKNAYRASVYTQIPILFLEELLNIASRVFKQKLKIGKECEKSILRSPEEYQDNSYKQLRALELLCSHYSFDKSLSGYIELIKKPNYACSRKALSSASTNHS